MWQLQFVLYVIGFIACLVGAVIFASGIHSMLTGESHVLSRVDIEQVTE